MLIYSFLVLIIILVFVIGYLWYKNNIKDNKINKLSTENATISVKLSERENHYQQQIDFIKATKEQISKDFKNIATDIIDKDIIKLSAKNKDTLLPLQNQIKDFKDRIEAITTSQTKTSSSLLTEIKNLQQASENTKKSADSLAEALTYNTKKQGNWGEMVLDSILYNSGLREGIEYEKQKTYKNEIGENLQPDIVVHLPDNKDIVIDAKVSLTAYENYINDNSQNSNYLSQHIKSIENHINNISLKNYEKLLGINSLDFILVFMPIEPALYLALQEKDNLFDYALRKGVVLASPSTLTLSLKVIYHIWKTEQQNKNAEEIARQAGNMYDKFSLFVANMLDIEKHLSKAQESQQKAYKDLKDGRGNLLSRAEKLKELGVQSKKQLPL